MKLFTILCLLIILILPNELRIPLTILASFIWFIYSVYYCYILYVSKDKKIVTSKYLETPPNNNYSPYIRYLVSGKIDYKVFFLVVIELIIKGSVSLKKENNLYYLFDNQIKNEDLKKSEIYVKKILFKDIGEGHYVILNKMFKKCEFNSGYLYSVYMEWVNLFEYEAMFNKYFKTNKKLIDKSTFFLVASFVISLYNVIFTKKIILALFIFTVAAIMCKYINDMKNREDDAKGEYEKWLEFKNYLNKKDNLLGELDAISLENYSLYAYSLDSYYSFSDILKNRIDNDKIEKSEILKMINNGDFTGIEYIFSKSIEKLNINAVLLFAKNKGRR